MNLKTQKQNCINCDADNLFSEESSEGDTSHPINLTHCFDCGLLATTQIGYLPTLRVWLPLIKGVCSHGLHSSDPDTEDGKVFCEVCKDFVNVKSIDIPTNTNPNKR